MNDLVGLVLAERSSLLAFAIRLTGNYHSAEDLVQETVLRAIDNIDTFATGTNLSAWLFTILRNLHRSQWRKKRREVEDPDGLIAGNLSQPADQSFNLQYEEAIRLIDALPEHQRDSFRLCVMEDYSYEDAADVLNCSVGTVKSRVNRAREALEAAGLFSASSVNKSERIKELFNAGMSASRIAIEIGESVVDVMKVIAMLGDRVSRRRRVTQG